MNDRRSPLKARPLRNPGEGLDREIRDLFYDQVLFFGVIAFMFIVLAGTEWWRWYRDTPPSPMLYTLFAVVAVLVAVLKWRSGFKKAKLLALGRDGEKIVGQFLDRLREAGARVFHDIPGSGFNLDHVVIDKTGLYVIETKTISKPVKGRPKLIYDGERITNGKYEPDRNPIAQVRAARTWLRELITESTGRTFPVRGVVLYPGWFIESKSEAKSSDIWVLNPKALPTFIANQSTKFSSEDIAMCSFHLGRYVRGVTNEP